MLTQSSIILQLVSWADWASLPSWTFLSNDKNLLVFFYSFKKTQKIKAIEFPITCVLLLLSAHSQSDDVPQLFMRRPLTQQIPAEINIFIIIVQYWTLFTAGSDQIIKKKIPQRNFGIAKQAHFQIAVGRQSQAVARSAEMIRHRRDESHPPAESWHLERLSEWSDKWQQ